MSYEAESLTHTLQLPTHPTHLMDYTFFIRMLYKDLLDSVFTPNSPYYRV